MSNPSFSERLKIKKIIRKSIKESEKMDDEFYKIVGERE